MKQFIIDGRLMASKDVLYEHLKEVFSLPPYFGNNFDALWDYLNETVEPTEIIFLNVNEAKEQLGQYGQRFIYLLEKLDEENRYYRIYFYA